MLARLPLILSACLLAAPAAAETVVIHAGRLITDAAKPATGPATIVVEDGRIARVEAGTQPAPAGAKVVELGDKTVMPGLIDVHVHLGGDADSTWYDSYRPKMTAPYAAAMGLHNAETTVRAGFTTVRELGGDLQATLAVRDAIDDGLFEGPRILTAGPALSPIGGHADPLVGMPPDLANALHQTDPAIGVCTGVDGCAAAVRRIARAGVDVIKFMATGGVLDDGGHGLEQAFTDEEMRSIVETANRLGLKVAAHAHGARGIEAAANAGVDSIEHGTLADAAAIRAMKAHGTWFVPTLMAFTGVEERLGKGIYTPNMEEKGRSLMALVGKALNAAYEAGVPIALGTDAAVYAHGRNGEEAARMVEQGGMAPRDVLIAATSGAARLLGLENEVGRIAPGYSADLIAVDGDPVQNIRVLEDVDWVMARGHVID